MAQRLFLTTKTQSTQRHKAHKDNLLNCVHVGASGSQCLRDLSGRPRLLGMYSSGDPLVRP